MRRLRSLQRKPLEPPPPKPPAGTDKVLQRCQDDAAPPARVKELEAQLAAKTKELESVPLPLVQSLKEWGVHTGADLLGLGAFCVVGGIALIALLVFLLSLASK